MTTEQYLLEKYGMLLTLKQLAETLKRSADGLRISLGRSSAFSLAVNATKVRLGRRVYFRASDVARLIDGSSGRHG
jgi:hypothetical protein